MQGIKLDIAKWRRPSPECGPVHAKAAGLYMICTLSKHEAEAKGYSDALMLDYRGQIAEATELTYFLRCQTVNFILLWQIVFWMVLQEEL